MKKGQEPGQLDKEAVGRITCRILQEEEPGGMLVKKLWRLAGMLICLLCLTGGLCSAFLSGFGIRYLAPVFCMSIRPMPAGTTYRRTAAFRPHIPHFPDNEDRTT